MSKSLTRQNEHLTRRQPTTPQLETIHQLLLQIRNEWGSYHGLLLFDEAIALLTKTLHK